MVWWCVRGLRSLTLLVVGPAHHHGKHIGARFNVYACTRGDVIGVSFPCNIVYGHDSRGRLCRAATHRASDAQYSWTTQVQARRGQTETRAG